MSKVAVKYDGNWWTSTELVRTKSKVQTHAPSDNSDSDTFTPTDFISVALGTCIMSTLAMGGEKYNFDISDADIEVEKVMADSPRRISELNVKVYFSKEQEYTDKDKTVLKRIANACVVNRSLHPNIKKEVKLIF